VKRVDVRDGDAFDIAFEDGSLISISLKPSDYVGSEALNFCGRDKQLVVI
jgi:hypothetical protein